MLRRDVDLLRELLVPLAERLRVLAGFLVDLRGVLAFFVEDDLRVVLLAAGFFAAGLRVDVDPRLVAFAVRLVVVFFLLVLVDFDFAMLVCHAVQKALPPLARRKIQNVSSIIA